MIVIFCLQAERASEAAKAIEALKQQEVLKKQADALRVETEAAKQAAEVADWRAREQAANFAGALADVQVSGLAKMESCARDRPRMHSSGSLSRKAGTLSGFLPHKVKIFVNVTVLLGNGRMGDYAAMVLLWDR